MTMITTQGDTKTRTRGNKYNLTPETARVGVQIGKVTSRVLQTYGVIYPAGLRRPELVPAGTQTAFRLYETVSLGGREKPDHAWHLYVRRDECLGSPLHPYL